MLGISQRMFRKSLNCFLHFFWSFHGRQSIAQTCYPFAYAPFGMEIPVCVCCCAACMEALFVAAEHKNLT